MNDGPFKIIGLAIWSGCKKGIKTLIKDKMSEKLEALKMEMKKDKKK